MDPSSAARILLRRRRMRESLVGFAQSIQIPGAPVGGDDSELFSPVGTGVARHHVVMLEALQKCIETDYGRLIIMTPPGAAKSTYASAVAPTWAMAKWPGFQTILTSYGTELAKKHGRKGRAIARQPVFVDAFGTTLSKDTKAAELWRLDNGAEYMAGGILSGITGNRADCFPAGTLVSTPAGPVPIESLETGHNVISFDIGKNCYTSSRVLATREIERGGLVEIETASGQRVRCTADHRIFTAEHGYRQAALLVAGDTLVCTPEGSGVESVPRLLRQGAQIKQAGHGVRALRVAIRDAAIRLREAVGAWRAPVFLRPSLSYSAASGRSDEVGVQDLRGGRGERSVVLQQRVLEQAEAVEAAGKAVPAVREGVSFDKQQDHVLLAGVREPRALQADGREGELALQDRDQLRGVVQADEAGDPGAGHGSVLRVRNRGCASARKAWAAIASSDPSLRRESVEQPAGQPDNDVREVPHQASQVGIDTVSVVRRIGGSPVPVYDIEVEATRCFFANEILVHNCVIGDDLIAGQQEAMSKATRAATWDAWESDVLSRLKPKGSVVLLGTRWHPLDPIGMLLPADYAGQSGPVLCSDGMVWNVLCIPAEAEREDDPLGRAPGEMLWPEWFTEEHWKPWRAKARIWASLFQQRPNIAGGDKFKAEWIQWYDEGEHPEWLNVYGFSDYGAPSEDTADPDFTEHGVFGMDENGDLWALDWFFGQVTTNVGVDAFLNLAAMWKPRRWWNEKGPLYNALKPEINRKRRERGIRVGLDALPSSVNKVARAESFFSMAEAGKVHLPRTPWARRLAEQLCAFPVLAHDDAVDVASLAGRALDGMAFAYVPMEPKDSSLRPFSVAWLEYQAPKVGAGGKTM